MSRSRENTDALILRLRQEVERLMVTIQDMHKDSGKDSKALQEEVNRARLFACFILHLHGKPMTIPMSWMLDPYKVAAGAEVKHKEAEDGESTTFWVEGFTPDESAGKES